MSEHYETSIISDSDIEALTGYKIPTKQCDVLRTAGIFFIIRKDGRPRTTWQHFNDPMGHRQKPAEPSMSEPNFGAID